MDHLLIGGSLQGDFVSGGFVAGAFCRGGVASVIQSRLRVQYQR